MSIRKTLKRTVLILLLSFVYSLGWAQPADDLPPDPGVNTLTVYKVQDMCFGAFSVGSSGGSILLTNSGARSATGAITLLTLSSAYYQAIFDIEAPEGTIISVTNGPDATLAGSNGGSISLKLGTCSPASPFTTTAVPPARTALSIGGTLTIGSASNSPPGQYSGTFDVYIDYQ